MAKNILTNAGAFLVFVTFSALTVPACTLRLGRAGEDGTDDTPLAPDGTQPTPGGNGAEDSMGFTPEEQEAIEAARKAAR